MEKIYKLSPQDIEIIVYDFDGVMTNNKVIVNQFGIESVIVNRSDGLAIAEIKKMGIEQIIISTEKNLVVKSRADKLGLKVLQDIKNKKEVLIKYCKKNSVCLDNVIYIGNDLNDKLAMEIVGWPMCPNDANESIKSISRHILNKCGGDGVVRELVDLIIKTKGE